MYTGTYALMQEVLWAYLGHVAQRVSSIAAFVGYQADDAVTKRRSRVSAPVANSFCDSCCSHCQVGPGLAHSDLMLLSSKHHAHLCLTFCTSAQNSTEPNRYVFKRHFIHRMQLQPAQLHPVGLDSVLQPCLGLACTSIPVHRSARACPPQGWNDL